MRIPNSINCLEHNNSHFQEQQFLQTHGTAMGPKNACSYADLAMGIIDQKAKSGGDIETTLSIFGPREPPS